MPISDRALNRKYQREWIAKRRLEYFKDKVCANCGESNGLELDHIDPTSKVTHRIWSFSKKKRDIELSKCQILCRNCHFKKTNKDNGKHGSASMYRSGCRCILCRRYSKVRGQRSLKLRMKNKIGPLA